MRPRGRVMASITRVVIAAARMTPAVVSGRLAEDP
jgi:hypothetical protein